MNSLVIQISIWRDDGTVRARLWSDAEEGSVAHAAATEDELIELIGSAVRSWARRLDR